jgi:short-subunit dehydrogenase
MAKGKVLVTGASRGIGKAIAEALTAKGYEVYGTARNPLTIPKKEMIPGVRYYPLDLTSERSVTELARKVRDAEIVIHNAGASMIGPAEEAKADRVRALFELNFFGPVRLTQALLPSLRRRGKAVILFVGSMHTEAATPFSSVYASSKAALKMFARTLRMESAKYGIRVAVVSPFHVATDLVHEPQYADNSPYRNDIDAAGETRERLRARAIPPKVVAGKVLQILSNPKPRFFYPVGRRADALAFLLRHLPTGIVDAIMKSRFGTG